MNRHTRFCIFRLGAAVVLLLLVLLGSPLPKPAVAHSGGGCSPEPEHACITTNNAYEDRACTSGQGEDCINCCYEPGHVCTWSQGARDLIHWYPGTGCGDT